MQMVGSETRGNMAMKMIAANTVGVVVRVVERCLRRSNGEDAKEREDRFIKGTNGGE